MTMKTDRFQIVAGLVALAATVALAQQAARPADVPNVPPRGPLTVDAAAITEILGRHQGAAGLRGQGVRRASDRQLSGVHHGDARRRALRLRRPQQLAAGRPGHGQRPAARRQEQRRAGRRIHRVRDDGQPARGGVRRRHALSWCIRRASRRIATPMATALPRSRGRSSAGWASASISAAPITRSTASSLASTAGSTSPSATTASSRPWAATGARSRCAAAATCACVPTAPGSRSTHAARATTTTSRSIRILNLFARGNTNDGGGWDIRLNHFVAGAQYGYPSLFRNFGDEVVAPLADYGGGSGTGMLFIQDPGLPAPFGDALYSVDWGTNFVYRHPLKPRGATFTAGQEVFLGLPRPTDIAIDGGLEALRGKLEGRAVSLRRRADRLHRPADLPWREGLADSRHQGRDATRGSSSSSRRPIRCTAASRSTSSSGAGRRPSASRCSRSACSAPGRWRRACRRSSR